MLYNYKNITNITKILNIYYNFVIYIDIFKINYKIYISKRGVFKMRVISGVAKGTKLETLETLDTRPTLDRVKEALFNIIQSKIYNAIVLDLFAGSGALGIEALSRGAKKVVFCDKSKYAYAIIKKNLTKTRFGEKSSIYNKSYEECLSGLKDKFDIVFVDPPYNTNLAKNAIKKILEKNLLAKNALVIVETNDEEKLIDSEMQVIDVRKYGKVKLVFLKRKEQE